MTPKPTIRKGGVERSCEECSATFYVNPKTIRRGHGRFCSATCSSLGTVCTPVRVRGVDHRSIVATAAAYNVSTQVVSYHLRRGTPDKIGVGKGRWKRDENSTLGNAKPFQLGQKTWPTRKAASEDLGLSYWKLWKMVKEGRTDLLMAAAMKMEAARGSLAFNQKKGA